MIDEDTRSEIVAQYQQGFGSTEIAEAFGIGSTTVLRILDESGVERRKPGRTREQQRTPEVDRRLARIVRLQSEGKSLSEIGEALNITKQAVHSFLKRWAQ